MIQAESQTPPIDCILRAIATERRRAILRYLRRSTQPSSLEDLAAELHGKGLTATRLHHVEIPALCHAGLVRREADERIDLTPIGSRLVRRVEDL